MFGTCSGTLVPYRYLKFCGYLRSVDETYYDPARPIVEVPDGLRAHRHLLRLTASGPKSSLAYEVYDTRLENISELTMLTTVRRRCTN